MSIGRALGVSPKQSCPSLVVNCIIPAHGRFGYWLSFHNYKDGINTISLLFLRSVTLLSTLLCRVEVCAVNTLPFEEWKGKYPYDQFFFSACSRARYQRYRGAPGAD